jgi:uncharacterized membrane protein
MPSDFGPGFHEGLERGFDGGPNWFGLIPLVMIAVLVGVVVWAVIKLTREGGHAALVGGPPAAPVRADAALEELRLRYARGEMTRVDYGERLQDLTGAPPSDTAPRDP